MSRGPPCSEGDEWHRRLVSCAGRSELATEKSVTQSRQGAEENGRKAVETIEASVPSAEECRFQLQERIEVGGPRRRISASGYRTPVVGSVLGTGGRINRIVPATHTASHAGRNSSWPKDKWWIWAWYGPWPAL